MHRRTPEDDSRVPLGQPKSKKDSDNRFTDGVVSIGRHGFRLCFRYVYIWPYVLARQDYLRVFSYCNHRTIVCSVALPTEINQRV